MNLLLLWLREAYRWLRYYRKDDFLVRTYDDLRLR